jgi:hypothetical protein
VKNHLFSPAPTIPNKQLVGFCVFHQLCPIRVACIERTFKFYPFAAIDHLVDDGRMSVIAEENKFSLALTDNLAQAPSGLVGTCPFPFCLAIQQTDCCIDQLIVRRVHVYHVAWFLSKDDIPDLQFHIQGFRKGGRIYTFHIETLRNSVREIRC